MSFEYVPKPQDVLVSLYGDLDALDALSELCAPCNLGGSEKPYEMYVWQVAPLIRNAVFALQTHLADMERALGTPSAPPAAERPARVDALVDQLVEQAFAARRSAESAEAEPPVTAIA